MNKQEQREAVARAIWNIRREEEDRCDMELEDIGSDHSVWQEADAAIAALSAQEQVEPTDEEILRCAERHLSIVFEEDEVISCVRALLSASKGEKG